jgi:hypothetical protein
MQPEASSHFHKTDHAGRRRAAEWIDTAMPLHRMGSQRDDALHHWTGWWEKLGIKLNGVVTLRFLSDVV